MADGALDAPHFRWLRWARSISIWLLPPRSARRDFQVCSRCQVASAISHKLALTSGFKGLHGRGFSSARYDLRRHREQCIGMRLHEPADRGGTFRNPGTAADHRWTATQRLHIKGALAWSVLVPSMVGTTLLMWMMRHGDATKVTALLLLVPPLAAVQAYLLFRETLAPVQFIGFALALGGVVMTRSASTRESGSRN